MNNNYTKLAKYGLVGICMALIGLMGFMLKQNQETTRQFNAIISNHLNESTGVMRELIEVSRGTKEMMEETKEVVKELKEWLWFKNGKTK